MPTIGSVIRVAHIIIRPMEDRLLLNITCRRMDVFVNSYRLPIIKKWPMKREGGTMGQHYENQDRFSTALGSVNEGMRPVQAIGHI
ncbi:hypothetical protein U9M48_000803 [Paspalum notatum var. saurae]|uniref:Uncharacterized protein n=1 Tax=Paspalum notatum var. saurae TaxID=547442 RepID=A0AAQ3SES7_PASNO